MYSNYIESVKNLKTVTLVAGEGEGSARKTTTVTASGGAKSGLERREMFSDARDISQTVEDTTLSDAEYIKQLTQRGAEELAEYVYVKSFEAEAETNATVYEYGVDYFIGDIVQMANEYGHMCFSQAAQVAREAGVRQLWLSHYSQMIEDPAACLPAATAIFENTVCGEDGMRTTLRFAAE